MAKNLMNFAEFDEDDFESFKKINIEKPRMRNSTFNKRSNFQEQIKRQRREKQKIKQMAQSRYEEELKEIVQKGEDYV